MKSVLNVYRFTDGIKAYFFNDDKYHHLVVQPDETFHWDGIEPEQLAMRELQITYTQWRRMVMR